MTITHPFPAGRPVISVKGPIPHEDMGITDTHNHVWIAPVPGAEPGSPVLDQFDLILAELHEYRDMGGATILDCQPGGCGRDGNQLLALSSTSQVHLLACTGFHRKKYYPPAHWLWSATAEKISDFLNSELEQGLQKTLEKPNPVRAGFIKIALESTWNAFLHAGLEGTAATTLKTKALVEIHTEKGGLAEKICVYFTDLGISPNQLVLCHMDKRPDASLHKELARLGVFA